jgi:hypothetical protein
MRLPWQKGRCGVDKVGGAQLLQDGCVTKPCALTQTRHMYDKECDRNTSSMPDWETAGDQALQLPRTPASSAAGVHTLAPIQPNTLTHTSHPHPKHTHTHTIAFNTRDPTTASQPLQGLSPIHQHNQRSTSAAVQVYAAHTQ